MNSSQSSVGIVERAYAFISLLFLMGAYNPGTLSITEAARYRDLTDGNPTLQAIAGVIYLISLAILLTQSRQAIHVLSRNKILILFVLLTVASIFWSLVPEVSMRRSLALGGTTIFGCYLAVRFRPADLLTLVAWAFAFLIFENLIAIFLVPSIGVHSYVHDGAWRGVLGHKNDFGRVMLLGAIVFWVISQQSRAAKPWAWSGIILCLAMVVLSQSRTAWLTMAFLLIAIPFLRFLRRSDSSIEFQIRFILVGLVGGCIAIFLIENVEEILVLMGRDATLTGRTGIWAKAFEVGMERFWLGYGYRSFWIGDIFKYGHGHNSLLDLWLELGLVGAALFIYLIVVLISGSLKKLVTVDDELGLWYVLFVVFVVFFSITSQAIPEHGTITWTLFVASLVYLTSEPSRHPHPSVSRVIPESG